MTEENINSHTGNDPNTVTTHTKTKRHLVSLQWNEDDVVVKPWSSGRIIFKGCPHHLILYIDLFYKRKVFKVEPFEDYNESFQILRRNPRRKSLDHLPLETCKSHYHWEEKLPSTYSYTVFQSTMVHPIYSINVGSVTDSTNSVTKVTFSLHTCILLFWLNNRPKIWQKHLHKVSLYFIVVVTMVETYAYLEKLQNLHIQGKDKLYVHFGIDEISLRNVKRSLTLLHSILVQFLRHDRDWSGPCPWGWHVSTRRVLTLILGQKRLTLPLGWTREINWSAVEEFLTKESQVFRMSEGRTLVGSVRRVVGKGTTTLPFDV